MRFLPDSPVLRRLPCSFWSRTQGSRSWGRPPAGSAQTPAPGGGEAPGLTFLRDWHQGGTFGCPQKRVWNREGPS